MAYNLQSLITILEQILNPQQTRWIIDHNKPQLQSLLEKAASLHHILEKSSPPQTLSLQSQIREAAHKAEDLIESYMVEQMLSIPKGASFTFSTPDLQKFIQQLDSIMQQVVKLLDGDNLLSDAASSSSGASFSRSRSVVVGVDADLMQLKDRLIGTRTKLEIIPIVGMGGVGKTTLARTLYEDPLIVSRFRPLAWTTVSQDYNMKAILSCLLRCIVGKEFTESVDELKDILYKSLFGKRYMIVLDDIWNTRFWDDIRKYFPDNNNGSRILFTTRESDVAKYADSQSLQHQVQLLSESQSWNLLCQIVFGEEDCPHVLQDIGQKIARDCGGLPLAINVIGGLLSKVQRSKYVWQNIANDVRATIAESDREFSHILSLSYNHLPNYLKPCFLYLGVFPEDYEIMASELIHVYVAEGFLRSSTGGISLEEEAENCLKALVERNLLLVTRTKSNGKPSSYNIHDLLRDVCMRKADEEKFLQIKNASKATSSKTNMQQMIKNASKTNIRHVSVHTFHGLKDGCASAELMPLARSFLMINPTVVSVHLIPSPVFFMLRLLRVLDVLPIVFDEFPREILQLVRLRYLCISCRIITSEISKLWNLQTLIARIENGYLPCEVFEMSELRHIKYLNRPVWMNAGNMKRFAQKQLQTMPLPLVVLTPSLIERGFLENIPNIKDFGVYLEDHFSSSSTALDLSRLDQLEKLRCCSKFYRVHSLQTLKFPSTIKTLTLRGFLLFPAVLTTLCALPKLEVLKIRECKFKSEEAHEDEEWEEEQMGMNSAHSKFYSSKDWIWCVGELTRLISLDSATLL